MGKTNRTAWAFILPAFILLLVIGLYPLLYAAWVSLHSYHLDAPYLGMPFVYLSNYGAAFRDPLFLGALKRTGLFLVLALGFELILGGAIALLLDRKENAALRAVTRVALVVPIAMTPVVVGLIGQLVFNEQFGLVNYVLGLIGMRPIDWLGNPLHAFITITVMQIWQWTPFVALVLLASLSTVPDEIIEAAKLETNSWLTRLRHIQLPFMMPGITAALIFQSAYIVKLFDMVYTLTRGGPGESTDLVSLQIERLAFRAFNVGQAAAESVIMLIVTILLAQLYIRFFYSEATS